MKNILLQLILIIVFTASLAPTEIQALQPPTSQTQLPLNRPTDPSPAPINDETLTVTTIEREPFVIITDGELSGFSIELWEEIAKAYRPSNGGT